MKKEDDLNGDRLPLFRQGGATVRRMNRGGGSRPGVEGPRITQSAGSMGWDLKFSFIILEVRWFSKGP